MPYAGGLSYGGTIVGPPAETTWLRITARTDPSTKEIRLTPFTSRYGGSAGVMPRSCRAGVLVRELRAVAQTAAPAPTYLALLAGRVDDLGVPSTRNALDGFSRICRASTFTAAQTANARELLLSRCSGV